MALAMSCWFSSVAVLPSLSAIHGLTSTEAALLAVSTQLGFALGGVLSALVNLADRVRLGSLIATASLVTAVANGLLLVGSFELILVSRLVVGCALAGVYAPTLKLLASHFNRSHGTAMALAVGALALGSASSHLVASGFAWREVVWTTSAAAIIAAGMFAVIPTGPHLGMASALRVTAALRALRDVRIRRITISYLGHMWELYAFWAFAPALLSASAPDLSEPGAGLILFCALGLAGFGGCVVAGVLADSRGRLAVARAALATSGVCAAASPLLFHVPTGIVIVVLTVWGATVIADSAQFSAASAQAGDPAYVGSLLTLQTALGFALAAVSIALTPWWERWLGQSFALVPLALGPLVGVLALAGSRRSTATAKGNPDVAA
jgi:predicted MFS family arabinose efflux permease